MKLKKSFMGILCGIILFALFSLPAHAAGTYTVKFNETLNLYLSSRYTITSASWSSSDARIVQIVSSGTLGCTVMGVDNEYGTSATITCNYTYLLAGRAFRSSERFTVRVPSESGGGGTGSGGTGNYVVTLTASPSSVTLDLAKKREQIVQLDVFYRDPFPRFGGYGADVPENSCVQLKWGEYSNGRECMTVVANKIGSQNVVAILYEHTEPIKAWGKITVPVKVICSHLYGKQNILRPATEDVLGLAEKTCQFCKKTITEEIPKKATSKPETPKPEKPKPNGADVVNPPSAGTVLTDDKTKAAYVVVKKSAVWYKRPASKNITKASIPETVKLKGINYKVTGISDKAFNGCTKLKKVSVGKNITYIGKEAFKNCKKITNFTIPIKVSKIGAQAFYGCGKLKFITIKTLKLDKKYVGARAFKGIYAKAVIKVPKQKKAVYKRLLKEKGTGKKVKVS